MSMSRKFYFYRIENFRFNKSAVVQFVILCSIIWISNIFVQSIFPTENNFPFIIRNLFAVTTVVLLLIGTKKLLAKNNITTDALGLSFSFKIFQHVLSGLFLAIAVLSIIGLFIYAFVPFHFERGTLSGSNAIKHASDFFWTNTLEEFIFRGFPLLVLSKMYGWKKAVWLLALPFGLFHLYGMGLGTGALKMVLTTAAYSFVFCYAYLFTNSLVTAISVHWFSNILLHTITGLDGQGNAMLEPKFQTNWPIFDVGFLAFLLSEIVVAFFLFFLIKNKRSLRLSNIEK